MTLTINTNKILTTLSLLLCFANSISAKQMPEFILGTWQINDNTSYEQWRQVSESQYRGAVIETAGGIKTIKENLSLEIKDGFIIYQAQVLNQNDGSTITFTGAITDSGFKVANPNHDFPQTIEYIKVAEDEIQTQVTAKDHDGFSQKLVKKQQPDTIPTWFLTDLASNIGTWVTDNSKYQSATEPYENYAVEWQWGIGKTSITGRLYGIKAGQESGDFWQFRQYWDNPNKQAVLQQFGASNVIGIGAMQYINPGHTEVIQTFTRADGASWQTKHDNQLKDGVLTTTSYNRDKDLKWRIDRTYLWHKL